MYQLKKDINKLYIKGTLVKLDHAPVVIKDKKGVERASEKSYYQLAIKTKAPTPQLQQDIIATYYNGVEDTYIPKWLKPTDDTDIYINCKSLYDLAYFTPADDGSYDRIDYDVLVDGGAPLGSDVVLSLRCKEGAMYADAVKFLAVKHVTVDDYFK